MGLNAHGIRALVHAKNVGVEFSTTATIGRQALFLTPEELRAALTPVSSLSLAQAQQIRGSWQADEVYRRLGASTLHFYDFSDFEGATHTHDFNNPLPDLFKEQYDVVIESGSLEHIFNFPTALKNCMEMLRVGGHFVAITPCNNQVGHGFFQFSPEAYFAALAEENGFKTKSIIVYEERPNAPWYEARRPSELKGRLEFSSRYPAQLFVIAQRTAIRPIFASMPQQRFYERMWRKEPVTTVSPSAGIRSVLRKVLPQSLRTSIRQAINAVKPPESGFDPRFFTRVPSTANDEENRR